MLTTHPRAEEAIEPECAEAVLAVLRSGWLTTGPATQAFEAAFAARLGRGQAAAVSSRTAALHLALVAAGVGPGDEVILSALAGPYALTAVARCGAVAVAADVRGQYDLGLEPGDVALRTTRRTRAVCAVHPAGYAAPAAELRAVCDAAGIALVEDAGDAPGTVAAGRPAGTWGAAAAFSFCAEQIMGVGEAGLTVTGDDERSAVVLRLRSQGMTSGSWSRFTRRAEAYDAIGLGYNYRLDEVRAALLGARLARLDAELERRRALTQRYRQRLAGCAGLVLPYSDADIAGSSCQAVPALVEDRDRVVRSLREQHAIALGVLGPTLAGPDAGVPHAEDVGRRGVILPLRSGDSEADWVMAAIEEVLS